VGVFRAASCRAREEKKEMKKKKENEKGRGTRRADLGFAPSIPSMLSPREKKREKKRKEKGRRGKSGYEMGKKARNSGTSFFTGR